jgi:intein/homing endonuclease
MRSLSKSLMFLALTVGLNAAAINAPSAQEVYQSPRDFLNEAFDGKVPLMQSLVIDNEVRKEAERILRHGYGVDRVNYWSEGNRTIWILEEIGRYRPITVGLIVSNGKIETIRVLIFRESHGWEVQHAFFTDQFKGLSLDAGNELTANIDGISGATLSVNALRSLARLALYFDAQVQGR